MNCFLVTAGLEDENWILQYFSTNSYSKQWLPAALSVLIIIKVTNTCRVSNYYSCNSFSTSFLYSSIPPSIACTVLLPATHNSLHTTLIRRSSWDTRMTPPYNNKEIAYELCDHHSMSKTDIERKGNQTTSFLHAYLATLWLPQENIYHGIKKDVILKPKCNGI